MDAFFAREGVRQDPPSKVGALPLCVDLDGTLVLSDLLLETLVLLIKRQPLCLLLVPLWLLKGRAHLKAEIAARVTPNAEMLPYNPKLLEWLRSQHDAGRSLWLCTAAHKSIASHVAAHLRLFDGVIATDGSANLVGIHKATRLIDRFGPRGFDYCGNEVRDVAIWRHANGAIVVNDNKSFIRHVAKWTEVLHAFPRRPHQLREVMRALRPHQWTKNALIFVPLLTSHSVASGQSVIAATLAAIAFSLCASAVYILNDLLDIEADRTHHKKSQRPFAAGRLSIITGVALVPLLLACAWMIAGALPTMLRMMLASYLLISTAYSFGLKKVMLIDVVTLAVLYTTRIVSGAVAINVPLSFWLLLFSIFLFLSLAFVKRFAELGSLIQQRRAHAVGRNYGVEDVPALQSLGTASGYLSVVVLALYINSSEVSQLYSRPAALWPICVLLLYWIGYVWMKSQRGEMNDDPVVFALTDHTSQGVGVLTLVAILIAL